MITNHELLILRRDIHKNVYFNSVSRIVCERLIDELEDIRQATIIYQFKVTDDLGFVGWRDCNKVTYDGISPKNRRTLYRSEE